MNSKDRFVFDTSVLASAVLIASSHPAEAFRKARQTGDSVVPKFDRYITREDRERFLAALIRAAKFIEVTERIVACRDLKDDKFLCRQRPRGVHRDQRRRSARAASVSRDSDPIG